jgi:AcrR family transcriptional regulator
MQKTDRRVCRTRRRLHSALIALILEKGYDMISVQDVTDRADLSRATFYLHFKDKDELLASSLKDIFNQLSESVKLMILQQQFNPYPHQPSALPAFQHVAENAELYRALLGSKGISSVIYRTLNQIAHLSSQQFEILQQEQAIENIEVPIDFVAQHMAGSLLSTFRWWLENDMPYSAEDMARMYERMTVPVVISAVRSHHPGSML